MTAWPPNMTVRPITRPYDRKWSPFRTAWSNTLTLLARELENLGAARVVLELDVTESDLRIDGMPRASARPATPAVALSFDSDYGPLRYATDVFNDWQDNLRAIALGLEALRKVDRYGISKRGEQYTGWKALPATPSGRSPIDVFQQYAGDHAGTDPRALYRAALLRVHPDGGGDRAAFDAVQAARKQLEEAGTW